MSRLGITLLGGFEVRVDGRAVPARAWRHKRAADLVKVLALAPGQRLHRERVIDTIWPELSPAAGAANLRKAAHHARRTLDANDAIVLRGAHVALTPDAEVDVDAIRFERAAQEALTAGDPDACARIAGQYRGELLPDDRYEEWAEDHRGHVRDLYLQLLRRAGLWERVVESEPTDEAAVRALMLLNADAGNRSEALARYHRLRTALAALELEPSEESVELFRRIARAPLKRSRVRYVASGDVNIAYQVVEGGPADLVLIPGWVSHLELDWEEPYWVRWCERMTSFARLIRFDKRGTGLSDRPSGVQPVEARMADALAVLDAAGVERAHVLGWSEGGPLALLLAAEHPGRVRSLTLYGTQACFRSEPGYPWGATDEERERWSEGFERGWPESALHVFAPRADEGFLERHGSYLRAGASPRAAAELNRMNLALDLRHLLPRIDVPVLVLCRRGDPIAAAAAASYMAEGIEGARYVELEGDDHVMWLGETEPLCSEIERFVLAVDALTAVGNVLGTHRS